MSFIKKSALVVAILFSIKGIIVLSLLIYSGYYLSHIKESKVVGNEEILKEINRILLPISNLNVTPNDFSTLKNMVKKDGYAKNEVGELILLAKYKEYSHIGHGIGFLYQYVKTGNESICPGHLLSHYYIFIKHNENETANDNLNEVIALEQKWNGLMEKKNTSYLTEVNYTYYRGIISENIKEINLGNSSASEEQIGVLSEVPCA